MNFYHTDKGHWFKLKEYARKMRKEPTISEKIVWNSLRDNRLGFKFRRQYVILNYIVDFVCLEKILLLNLTEFLMQKKRNMTLKEP